MRARSLRPSPIALIGSGCVAGLDARGGGGGFAGADGDRWRPDLYEMQDFLLSDVCEGSGLSVALEGLSGEDVADQVFALTVEHDCTSYDDARLFMMDRLDADQGWLDSVYIGARAAWDGTATPGSLNTEHTWPQSHGADVNPARCDLHHLYPADWGVNSRRSNLRFGTVEDPTWTQAGSSRGLDAEGVTVFEPRDSHKGNAARSLLYYAARYDGALDRDYMELLIEWAAFDPPDEREVARTFAIAEEQGAVNPYVICPDAVDRL